MLVVDVEKMFQRPDESRSISCFQRNNIEKYLKPQDKLVLYKKVVFDPKQGLIYFFPKKIGKPLLTLPVGRFYGDLPKKKTEIDWEEGKFFDLDMNRVNLILSSVS